MIRINMPWSYVEDVTPLDDAPDEPSFHDKIVSLIRRSDFQDRLISPKTPISIAIKAFPPGYRTIDAVDLGSMVVRSVRSVLGRDQIIDNLLVRFKDDSENNTINIKISVA